MDNKCFGFHYSPYVNSKTKRCLDIFICLLFLIPAILILLAIIPIVLIFDGRPVLFFQKRVGKNGKEFLMPKIRTLKKHTHPNRLACSYNIDSFVTRTGCFLRKHRLDELPQIFSVLTGKMSMVGPRPEIPNIAKSYSKKECQRLCSRPGLTGLWQIKASRNHPIHQNIKYDIYYLKKASFWFDIRILGATIPFVLNPKHRNSNEENRLHTYSLSLPK